MIRFRRTVPEDMLTISAWISQDEEHQGIDPMFFATTTPGVSCYAVEADGQDVMFVRQEREGETIILHIQFSPFDRRRIAAALREGYPLVAADAKERGFKRVRFESKSKALVRTMLDLGFRAELIADL